MTDDKAWDAMVVVNRLEALLPDELYAGSKDWAAADVVGRVEWLLAMYESAKADSDQLVAQWDPANDPTTGEKG